MQLTTSTTLIFAILISATQSFRIIYPGQEKDLMKEEKDQQNQDSSDEVTVTMECLPLVQCPSLKNIAESTFDVPEDIFVPCGDDEFFFLCPKIDDNVVDTDEEILKRIFEEATEDETTEEPIDVHEEDECNCTSLTQCDNLKPFIEQRNWAEIRKFEICGFDALTPMYCCVNK